MVWFPDGSGAGIHVRAGDQQVAMLADQLQDALVESLPSLGLPAVWPECPDHPDSHPLQAVCDEAAAVWTCPRTGRQVGPIGQLRPGRA
jgi:hypothetical protein